MPCMLLVDGIHDALLPLSKRLVAVIEMCYRLRHIHHRSHLLRLVVPVGTPFLQSSNLVHHQTVRSGAHIFKVREPSLINKPLDILRLQQHVEELSKALPAQSARRRRQSQELRLRPHLPQPSIRLRHRMMRLIHNNQRKVNRKQRIPLLRPR